jgi:formylmethanofuran dehydrogenase subunit B
VIAGHTPEGLARLIDDDVEQAVAAAAATLETASRGIVYEHTPTSAPAQRLARELATRLEEARTRGVTIYDGEAAIALRAIEQGVSDARKAGGGDQAYLTLMGRLLQTAPPESRAV